MRSEFYIVDRFAKALDAEDYDFAASLLADNCNYTCRGKQYCGQTEIIASYRDNGEAANEFDEIRYESVVVAEQAGRFRIEFTDHLTHAGHRFTFRCEQLIELNSSGKIIRIEHMDLPGQLEGLANYRRILAENDSKVRP